MSPSRAIATVRRIGTTACLALLLAKATQAQIVSATVTLDGAQEVPPVVTNGTATAIVTANIATRTVTVSGSYSGLSSAQTQAHIHKGASGVVGGILVTLTGTGGTSGTFSGSGILTAPQFNDLLANGLYLNIHTTSHSGGELRGQAINPNLTYDFEVEPAQTHLILEGHVFGQLLNGCTGAPIGSVQDLGPIQDCSSGNTQIPLVIQQGIMKMVLQSEARTGTQRAHFAGGDVAVQDFVGTVGSCFNPTAEVDVTGFRVKFGSHSFPVASGGVPAGCSTGDNYSTQVHLRVNQGTALITVNGVGAPSSFDLSGKGTSPTPTCGSIKRRGRDWVLDATFGAASPLIYPFEYIVDGGTPCLLNVDMKITGTFSISGTIHAVAGP